jgi:polysaccharide deacetylase 2 family uncharacterized protein YibQ
VLASESTRQGITAYSRIIFLDDKRDTAAIISQLRKTEAYAEKTGQAIAIGHPHPETIAALSVWAASRNIAVNIVHVSAQRGMLYSVKQ